MYETGFKNDCCLRGRDVKFKTCVKERQIEVNATIWTADRGTRGSFLCLLGQEYFGMGKTAADDELEMVFVSD